MQHSHQPNWGLYTSKQGRAAWLHTVWANHITQPSEQLVIRSILKLVSRFVLCCLVPQKGNLPELKFFIGQIWYMKNLRLRVIEVHRPNMDGYMQTHTETSLNKNKKYWTKGCSARNVKVLKELVLLTRALLHNDISTHTRPSTTGRLSTVSRLRHWSGRGKPAILFIP